MGALDWLRAAVNPMPVWSGEVGDGLTSRNFTGIRPLAGVGLGEPNQAVVQATAVTIVYEALATSEKPGDPAVGATAFGLGSFQPRAHICAEVSQRTFCTVPSNW